MRAGQRSPTKDLGPAPLVDTEALEEQRLRKQQQLMEMMESQQEQQVFAGLRAGVPVHDFVFRVETSRPRLRKAEPETCTLRAALCSLPDAGYFAG